jgi:hypothetical protein
MASTARRGWFADFACQAIDKTYVSLSACIRAPFSRTRSACSDTRPPAQTKDIRLTTSLGVAAGIPAAAAQPSQNSDVEAALARACTRVTTADPRSSLQKAALIAASVQLGAIADLSLERAVALLLVAARAAGYPKELDGEALPSLVKRWLQSWRGVSGSPDYSD